MKALLDNLAKIIAEIETRSNAVNCNAIDVDVVARIDVLAKRLAATIDSQKDYLRDVGTPVRGLSFAANIVVTKTTRLDAKALQESHPRIYAAHLVTSESKRLTFKAIA